MELNESQKQAVAGWVALGSGISEVQKRLNTEFGLNLTYMDVRFLLIELDVTPKDKPTPPAAATASAPPANAAGSSDAGGSDAFPATTANGGVRVSFDKVVQAGAIVSGAVTFSDGVSASWMLDQMGRIAINAATPGYRPGESDLQAFQIELRNELQKMGF